VEHLSIGASTLLLYGMVQASDVLREIVRQAWEMGQVYMRDANPRADFGAAFARRQRTIRHLDF
jgi:hypothetical protein